MDNAIQEWEHAALSVVYFVGDVNRVLLGRLCVRCGGVGARHGPESGRACPIHLPKGQPARGCCPGQRGLATGYAGVGSLQGRQEMDDTAFP